MDSQGWNFLQKSAKLDKAIHPSYWILKDGIFYEKVEKTEKIHPS
jgi:hypothetical protein